MQKYQKPLFVILSESQLRSLHLATSFFMQQEHKLFHQHYDIPLDVCLDYSATIFRLISLLQLANNNDRKINFYELHACTVSIHEWYITFRDQPRYIPIIIQAALLQSDTIFSQVRNQLRISDTVE